MWLLRLLPINLAVLLSGAAFSEDPVGVDPGTIPQFSNYPPLKNLNRVFVVAPGGNDDEGEGTLEKPLRTIGRAAGILQPGQGAFVRAGIYRERVAPARGGTESAPIVYCAEHGLDVVIKGSDVWTPSWKQESASGNTWSAKPDEGLFTDDVYLDRKNPLKVMQSVNPDDLPDEPLLYTIGQVFIDGRFCKQVGFVSELSADNTWYYDAQSEMVKVHFPTGKSPGKCQIELTTRRRIFAPHALGLGYLQIYGFVMEHCGNQYPRDFWSNRHNAQAGALGTRSGHHWTIAGNHIRFANSAGLDLGYVNVQHERTDPEKPTFAVMPGQHMVTDNVVSDNGAIGMMGFQAKNMTVRGNILERNGHLNLIGTFRWEGAAIKFHCPDHTVVEGNLIRDNKTNGVWFDQGVGQHGTVSRNLIVNNAEKGIFIETGDYGPDTGFIIANILIGNRTGYYCHDGSGVTFLNNLVMDSLEYGVQIWQMTDRDNTRNHTLYNNLYIGNALGILINYPTAWAINKRLDGNVYGQPDASRRLFSISNRSAKPPPWTTAAFLDHMVADLGKKKSDFPSSVLKDPMPLLFGEWQRFWQQHDDATDGETASLLLQDLTASFDATTLTLNVPSAVMGVKTHSHSALAVDYLGAAFPTVPMPGPIQHLVAGSQKIVLWGGTATDAPPVVRTPAAVSGLTATTASLAVLGDDDHGESALIYTWEMVTGPRGVVFSSNESHAAQSTTATFKRAGSYGFKVTITDASKQSVTSSVAVTISQELARIQIRPTSARIVAGDSEGFHAWVRDQFGVDTGLTPTWSVSGGGGISPLVSPTTTFTAGRKAGSYLLSASVMGLKSSVPVAVVGSAAAVATAAADKADSDPVTTETPPESGVDGGGGGCGLGSGLAMLGLSLLMLLRLQLRRNRAP